MTRCLRRLDDIMPMSYKWHTDAELEWAVKFLASIKPANAWLKNEPASKLPNQITYIANDMASFIDQTADIEALLAESQQTDAQTMIYVDDGRSVRDWHCAGAREPLPPIGEYREIEISPGYTTKIWFPIPGSDIPSATPPTPDPKAVHRAFRIEADLDSPTHVTAEDSAAMGRAFRR